MKIIDCHLLSLAFPVIQSLSGSFIYDSNSYIHMLTLKNRKKSKIVNLI